MSKDDTEVEKTDDTEEPEAETAKSKSSFDLIHSAKLGFFVLLLFILLMSDVFIERVMAKVGVGLVDGRIPTTRGIAIQGLLLVIGLIIFDFLITKETI
jgi:hypothetical protein